MIPCSISVVSEFDSNKLTGLAAKNFGHVQLKGWQEKVLSAVLQGQHAIVAQPTGSGKSLCYQLPPFATGGVTLVITPTLSLIHDQVKHLEVCVLSCTSDQHLFCISMQPCCPQFARLWM